MAFLEHLNSINNEPSAVPIIKLIENKEILSALELISLFTTNRNKSHIFELLMRLQQLYSSEITDEIFYELINIIQDVDQVEYNKTMKTDLYF